MKQAESTCIDLTKADVVVAGGRGVGDPEKFPEVIQPLADSPGGAMGASRPVVDAGWLPHAHQVGSSGQVVTPKLYIACGISGTIQHLVGIKSSNYSSQSTRTQMRRSSRSRTSASSRICSRSSRR